MSEEEKKAIEVMKSIEFDIYEWWYDGKRIDIEIDSDIANKSLQTILNLIEKQNKKIEELERDNKIRNDIGCGLMKELLVNYIPKSVIREKIEELKAKTTPIARGDGKSSEKLVDTIKMLTLKELLKEE